MEIDNGNKDIDPMIFNILMKTRAAIIPLKDLNTLRQVSPNSYKVVDEEYWDRRKICFQILDDEDLNKYMASREVDFKRSWSFHNIYREYNTNNLKYALEQFDWDEIRDQVKTIAPFILHLRVGLIEMIHVDPYQITLPMDEFSSISKLSVEFVGYCNEGIEFINQLELFKQIYDKCPNDMNTIEIIVKDDEVNIPEVLEFVATNTTMNTIELTIATNVRVSELEKLDLDSLSQSLSRRMDLKLNIRVISEHTKEKEFNVFFEKYAPKVLKLSMSFSDIIRSAPYQFDFCKYQWKSLEDLELLDLKTPLTFLSCFPKLKSLELRCVHWDHCGITNPKIYDETEHHAVDNDPEVLERIRTIFTSKLPLRKLHIENYAAQEHKLPSFVKAYLDSLYEVKWTTYKPQY